MQLWLSRYANFVVFFTILLIFSGGMLTSLDAGMTVPDWPTTFGYNMFAFPLERWTGPHFPEHLHRLVASVLGVLATVLAVWVWMVERRRWVRYLGLSIFLLALIQGLMGGFRVTEDSKLLAILHGCLAQMFLCFTVWVALALSPKWDAIPAGSVPQPWLNSFKRWSWVLLWVVLIQLILGAIMRHLKAGLAIPTFPLTPQGTFFPVVHNGMVHLHFTHRFWAIIVTAVIVIVAIKAFRTPGARVRQFVAPAVWLLILLLIQLLLGAGIIWLARAPIPTSLHVVNGALILVLSFVLAIRASYLASKPADGRHPVTHE